MKKLATLFLAAVLLIGVLGSGNAQAYAVSFDHQGTGMASNLIKYDLFQLVQVNNPFTFTNNSNLLGGASNTNKIAGAVENGHVFTVQDVVTGAFTESFKVRVSEGIKENADTEVFSNILMDINLVGQYFNDDNIQFTGGTAQMYQGANVIASFGLQSALISELTGSLLGEGGLGMKIDFNFIVNSVNSNYFGSDEVSLVDKGWLFSFAAGRIDQQNIWLDPTANDYIIEWRFPGAQMGFNPVVPEPGTMLLMGFGLLGMAAVARRRKN